MNIHRIIRKTAKHYGMSKTEMLSGRAATKVAARQIVVGIARHATVHSYPEIARALQMRDHTPAITAYRRFLERLDDDEVFFTDARAIAKKLDLEHLDIIGQQLSLGIFRACA